MKPILGLEDDFEFHVSFGVFGWWCIFKGVFSSLSVE
jgi:hypothetical protein